MKNDFDFITKGYTGDTVIDRGYDIYDGWKEKSLSSRRIVAEVERAVSAIKDNKTKAARSEALSYLFALDMRIKERYEGLLRCLFSYFSWRREIRALDMLKDTLRIPQSEEDIRTAIEVALEQLREDIELETSDEDDDETHGGRRNGKAEEEAAAEEKEQEHTSEDSPENSREAEEADKSEESIEEGVEAQPDTVTDKEAAENPEEATDLTQKEPADGAQEEAEQALYEESPEIKLEEENNGAEDSEPSEDIDKSKEARTYNDAVDSPPLYEETSRSTKTETTSFIDEVIKDNMVKGKEDVVRHNPLQDAKQSKETSRTSDTPAQRNVESKTSDKDAHLYDKMVLDEKGGVQKPTEKVGMQNPTEKKPEAKTEPKPEQVNEQLQDGKKIEAVKQESENTRVPLQVDITNQQEVQAIRELNDTMSLESKLSYIRMQEDLLREQLSISNKELGLDDNHGVLAIKEPDTASQLTAIQNKK